MFVSTFIGTLKAYFKEKKKKKRSDYEIGYKDVLKSQLSAFIISIYLQ